MIISFGILSILQLTLVPGLIIAKLFRIRGFWENLIAAIGLSQLFNYLFVIIATLLNVYTQTTTLILFGIEVFVLFVLYFPNLNWRLVKVIVPEGINDFFRTYSNTFTSKIEWKRKFTQFFYYFVFVVSIICLIRYFILYIAQPTQIFTRWDAVVSWDNWATQWFCGVIPLNTEHYPQLWPTNLSLPYQFIGTVDVKYFSKYFANLLEFFIILYVFILGIKKREIGYFLGVFFTSWLLLIFGSQGSGYADSPVAYWALSAIVCILLANNREDQDRLILLGAFFVAGAALTKQAGLWLVLTYPVLVALLKSYEQKKSLTLIFKTVLIMLLMVTPWYIFKEIQILTGIETSEVGRVTSLVLNKNNVSSIIGSAGSLFVNGLQNNYLPKAITFVFLLVFHIFSYKERSWRWINILVIIPFTLGWVFFFSYESRNLAMVIPLIGIALGIGIQIILDIDTDQISKFFHKGIPLAVNHYLSKIMHGLVKIVLSIRIWLFLLLIPIIFILPFWVSDNRLVTNSLIKQRSIGDVEVNQLLYDYKASNGLNGKIVTSYPYLGFLPELGPYYIYSPTNNPEFFDIFNDPDTGYALFNDHWWSAEVRDYVMSLVDEKKIQLIFTYPTPSQNGTFYFVTTCHGVCK